MIESAILVAYAIASVSLAFWLGRRLPSGVDWSHSSMHRPAMRQPTRHNLGSGALGAADAVSTSLLGAATPGAVLMFVVIVGSLIGGVIGAGVVPAICGGIGQPGVVGMLALMVAMLAWAYVGGKLALPMMFLALALAPVLIALAAIVFGGMYFLSLGNEGRPKTPWISGAWEQRFGARLNYNLCAAASSAFMFGNPGSIERKCQRPVVGEHPIVGRYAGIYSCGTRRIAAIVDVGQVGQFRDDLKNVGIDFSDRPESVFPLGSFGGNMYPVKSGNEFYSDSLAWIQKAGKGWGMPNAITVTSVAPDRVRVRLVNTPCTPLEAVRCQAGTPNAQATCRPELERQGVTLHVARTMREFNQDLAAAQARARE